ncbi:unnamed protein product [marine sediment metagenome]|uniref:Uncharacterized protein n=1 Tax=marine sediment metagenome TaxID=412755 RepID=X0YYL8_9ZZZZ
MRYMKMFDRTIREMYEGGFLENYPINKLEKAACIISIILGFIILMFKSMFKWILGK